MSKIRVELNGAGVRELLKSSEMMAICENHANKALSRLGDGYTVTTMTGKSRVNASVYAESYEAQKDNMENNTILKALRG